MTRETDRGRRVEMLYRLVLCRPPETAEVKLALDFVAAAERSRDKSRLDPWQQLIQVLLLTNEFLFVD